MTVMGNSLGLFSSNDPIDLDNKKGGGPRGKGDPADFRLREQEILVNIPRYQKLAATFHKCSQFLEKYKECAEDVYVPIYSCNGHVQEYSDCINQWSHDLKYREDITIEYLKIREEYRRTGRNRLYRGLKGEIYVTEEMLKGYQT